MKKEIDGDYIVGNTPYADANWSSIELVKGIYLSYTKGLDTISAENGFTVIGQIYNPENSCQSSDEISKAIFSCNDINELVNSLKIMAGCYVVIAFFGDKCFILTDATAQRKAYYLEKTQNGQFWLSSSLTILAELNNIPINQSLVIKAKHQQKAGCHQYLPFSLCQYNNIRHLIPNHYLSLNDRQSVRFYPNAEVNNISYSKSLEKAAEIISGSAKSILNKYPQTAIALTAGFDSRISLAAFTSCSSNINKVKAFTYHYPYVSVSHPDIVIAKELAKALSIDHQVIKLDSIDECDKRYVEVFGVSVPLIVSTISDIFRCFYRLPNIAIKPSFMLKKDNIPINNLTISETKDWLAQFQQSNKTTGYDIFDFYYWENRIARWASNGFTGCGLEMNKINIFNCRELLDIVLKVDKSKRKSGQFNKDLIELLCPGLSKIPFNPPQNFKAKLKKAFNNMPGESWLRYLEVILNNK